MTQVVEHLPGKHKVLSSNPSSTKRKKEKKSIDQCLIADLRQGYKISLKHLIVPENNDLLKQTKN
jgi:hypothetical protein